MMAFMAGIKIERCLDLILIFKGETNANFLDITANIDSELDGPIREIINNQLEQAYNNSNLFRNLLNQLVDGLVSF